MLVISGPRQSGKTTLLVKQSAETGYPIVCFSDTQFRHIKSLAKRLKLVIPKPISSFTQLNDARVETPVIVDDADLILKHVLKLGRIHSISVGGSE